MTVIEVMDAFGFVEKEDLQIWPEKCIEDLDKANVEKIMAYLDKNGGLSGEELFVLDLPAFLYPAEKFRTLWEALKKEHRRNFEEDIREEELTPSDEFPRLEKKR